MTRQGSLHGRFHIPRGVADQNDRNAIWHATVTADPFASNRDQVRSLFGVGAVGAHLKVQ
jgi:hypothetical protein